jgi:hypothetical protein
MQRPWTPVVVCFYELFKHPHKTWQIPRKTILRKKNTLACKGTLGWIPKVTITSINMENKENSPRMGAKPALEIKQESQTTTWQCKKKAITHRQSYLWRTTNLPKSSQISTTPSAHSLFRHLESPSLLPTHFSNSSTSNCNGCYVHGAQYRDPYIIRAWTFPLTKYLVP